MTSASDQPAVVVGVDGSEASLGAARWAADFAAGHGRPLTLVHVIGRMSSAGDADDVLGAAEAAVRAAHPDIPVQTRAVRGAVATALAEASTGGRVLVVAAGAADERALGGHVVRIVHRAQSPVLVWRAPVAKRTGKPLPVVVGVDESEASAHALAEGFDIAGGWHAPLTVAHMWELDAAVGMGDLGGQGMMDWPLLEVLETRQRDAINALLSPLIKKYPNAHVDRVFQDASPARGLTELSRAAQLVIVGSHGRGRFADVMLGSVSQNLIHHAECPVLVVR